MNGSNEVRDTANVFSMLGWVRDSRTQVTCIFRHPRAVIHRGKAIQFSARLRADYVELWIGDCVYAVSHSDAAIVAQHTIEHGYSDIEATRRWVRGMECRA